MNKFKHFENELESLLGKGKILQFAMYAETAPEDFRKLVQSKSETVQRLAKAAKDAVFQRDYQPWYTEALASLRFLIPERVDDFKRLYEMPKGRKELTYGNYVIEDYLMGLHRKNHLGEVVAGPSAAIAKFAQQLLGIVSAAGKRLNSSLFNITQVLQADLFDSELDAARELNRNGYARAAGAVCGVVLEAHLSQVCGNHAITIAKKDPSINDLNQTLKDSNVLDIPTWRFIQRLGDIRNLCDHKKTDEPTRELVTELIDGVDKIIKSVS